jgi:hypothetical protein
VDSGTATPSIHPALLAELTTSRHPITTRPAKPGSATTLPPGAPTNGSHAGFTRMLRELAPDDWTRISRSSVSISP